MPLVTVPQNAAPRLVSVATNAVSLCQLSPDGDDGCPPSGWINVAILPYGTSSGGVVTPGAAVSPDASGQFLHCLFSFAVPPVDFGKRRSCELNSPLTTLPASTGARTELNVETDAGRYFVGTPCQLKFMGGTPGDVYAVYVQFCSIKQRRDACTNVDLMEPAFDFELTSYFFTEGGLYLPFPIAPDYHTHFSVVQGSARVSIPAGFVPLDSSYGPSARIPLTQRAANSATGLSVQTGIYKTSGSF